MWRYFTPHTSMYTTHCGLATTTRRTPQPVVDGGGPCGTGGNARARGVSPPVLQKNWYWGRARRLHVVRGPNNKRQAVATRWKWGIPYSERGVGHGPTRRVWEILYSVNQFAEDFFLPVLNCFVCVGCAICNLVRWPGERWYWRCWRAIS